MRLGSSRCQCPTCEEYFSTSSNFDRHRVWGCGCKTSNHRDACYDTRHCANPAEVGLELKPWGGWGQPADSQRPVSAHGRRSESTEQVA